MNRSNILKKVVQLYELYQEGQIKTLQKHEVHPGLPQSSREHYLYFTLPPCINFQRSSPAMWQAALKTWNDNETRYLFFPEKVVKKSVETIQKDILRHRLAVQQHKHVEIWITICHTLNQFFRNDPRKILEAGNFDAHKILELIREDKREMFPYLGGPKLSNYWLYILLRYTDAKLKNRQYISIIPDTHVIQSSLKLGIIKKKEQPELVAQIWKKLLEGSDIQPVDMHPVLWNWSRNHFLPEV